MASRWRALGAAAPSVDVHKLETISFGPATEPFYKLREAGSG